MAVKNKVNSLKSLGSLSRPLSLSVSQSLCISLSLSLSVSPSPSGCGQKAQSMKTLAVTMATHTVNRNGGDNKIKKPHNCVPSAK